MALFEYKLLHQDAKTAARRGTFETTRGVVQLPTFMPVGTRGSVKGVDVGRLEETGSQIVLGNTYHLMLRPGAEIVRELGGLHKFCGWKGPMLTDSGGFQLFSLAKLTKITEEGAVFRSHIDGRRFSLAPESSVAIQEALGSDIAMVFDHVLGLPNTRGRIEDAMLRTIRWAKRCQKAHTREDQAQFAIIQGGLEYDLRRRCAEALAELDFPGYAIGGLSVGEEPAQMYECIEATIPATPANKPRYLMGVGRPEDLAEAILRGVDMFDCVMPSRNGRNAMAFTDFGPMRMRNARYERDERPLEEDCPCPACRRSRAYIRHLFVAGEMLGPILLTIHNITYYQRFMERARRAIENDCYYEFYRERMDAWKNGVPD
ncbi:MAG: tRNA guanosine(34) transglycosylase Tgt [Thermoguttaceae bacterium]|nr:tRNA guanosine(34) transglycosylase Tgt [Thermoguttaceae bacterium]